MNEPATKLDTRFSDPDAVATAWDETRRVLETAELFWISTVRPDGRPHVTPLVAVWLDGAIHFATSATEQKAVNLSRNLNQSLEAPLGVGGESLHEWMVTTKTFQQTYGNEGGTTGVDGEFRCPTIHSNSPWVESVKNPVWSTTVLKYAST